MKGQAEAGKSQTSLKTSQRNHPCKQEDLIIACLKRELIELFVLGRGEAAQSGLQ